MTAPTVPATPDTAVEATVPAVEAAEPVVAQDLLVEDVSIDGMCGVY